MVIAEEDTQIHIIFYHNFITVLVNKSVDVRMRKILETAFSGLD